MTAACPDLLHSTNIPFLDRNYPDSYTTFYQEEFQPFYSERAEPCHPPIPAQVHHRDLRHIKEFLTEARESYKHHQLPQVTHTSNWTESTTNHMVHTDPRDRDVFSTESQNLKPHPIQPPLTRFRPPDSKLFHEVERLPESTTQATFTPHHGLTLVKPKVKHLEERSPTIKWDGHHVSFVSQYKDNFQETCGIAAQPVKKHSSSVCMGDPKKIVERKTTHAASFSQPMVLRSSEVKKHLNLKPGNFYKDSWSSTSREDFCYQKLGDPVVRIKRNHNLSSLPKEDTDKKRNAERMSVTTNRISFCHLKGTCQRVCLPEPDLVTRSHVQFGPSTLLRFIDTTMTKEHYGKKTGARSRPVIQPRRNMLGGPEHGLSISTMKSDFLPLKISKQTLCLPQQKTNLKFPLVEIHFSTTTREDYTSKPLTVQRPAATQFCSHLSLKFKILQRGRNVLAEDMLLEDTFDLDNVSNPAKQFTQVCEFSPGASILSHSF